ncbi:hypothetical protein TrispH2_004148 [Trichoplax sp. H2]|nr:hypothetical protein TrispH2_004148 [Trichoplax sp. H2]|eukprot:RDD43455.1 hypothetical protein TrispH2_004148 [Trichoplax sp. H2]
MSLEANTNRLNYRRKSIEVLGLGDNITPRTPNSAGEGTKSKFNFKIKPSWRSGSKSRKGPEDPEEKIAQVSRDLERGVAILHYVCAFIGDTNYEYNGYYGYFGLAVWCLSLTLHFSFDFYDAFAVYQSAWGPALGVFFVAFCTLSYWTVTRTVPWVAVALRTLRDDSIGGYTYFKTIEITSFVCKALPIIIPFVGLFSTGGQYLCYAIDNALTVNISSIPALSSVNMTGLNWVSDTLSAVRFFSLLHVLSGYWVFNLCQLVLLFLVGMSMIEFQEQVKPKLKSHTGSYTFQQAVADISNRARFIRDASKSGTHVMTMLMVSSSVSFVLNMYSFFYMKVFAIYMWFAVVPGTISLSMLLLSAWVTSVYRNYRVTVVKAWVERKEDSEEESEDDESDGKSYFTAMRERINSVFKRKKLKTKKERDFLVLDKRFIMPPHFPIVTMPEIASSEIYPKEEITYLKKMEEEETDDERSTKSRFSFVRRRKGKLSLKNRNEKSNSSAPKAAFRKLPSTIVIEPPSSYVDPDILDKSDNEEEHPKDNEVGKGILQVSSVESDHSEDQEAPQEYSVENEFNLSNEKFLHPAPATKGDALNTLLPPIDSPIKLSAPLRTNRRHSSSGRVESVPLGESPSLGGQSNSRGSLTGSHGIPSTLPNDMPKVDEVDSTTDAISKIKEQFAHGLPKDADFLREKLLQSSFNGNIKTNKVSKELVRSQSFNSLPTAGIFSDDKEPVDVMTRFIDQRPHSRPPSLESLNDTNDISRPSASNKKGSKKVSIKSLISIKSDPDEYSSNITTAQVRISNDQFTNETSNKSKTNPEAGNPKSTAPVLRSSSEEGTSSTLSVSKTNVWKKLSLKRNRDEISEKSENEDTEPEPSTETQPRTKYTTAKLLTTMRGISKAFGKVQHKRKMQHFNFRKYIVYLDNFLPTVGYQIGGKVIQRDTIVLYLVFMLSFLALFAQEKLFGQTAQLGT